MIALISIDFIYFTEKIQLNLKPYKLCTIEMV